MKFKDDIAFNIEGQPVDMGKGVLDKNYEILHHPDAEPILMVAKLGDDVGMAVFGPPSDELANLLDYLAKCYRKAVEASKLKAN